MFVQCICMLFVHIRELFVTTTCSFIFYILRTVGPLNEMRNAIWTMFQWPDFRDQNVCTLYIDASSDYHISVFPLQHHFLVTFPARDVSLYGFFFFNPSWRLKELTHLVLFMLFTVHLVGLNIMPNGIIIQYGEDGRETGEAYVQFCSSEDAEKALEKHKMKIDHRWDLKSCYHIYVM